MCWVHAGSTALAVQCSLDCRQRWWRWWCNTCMCVCVHVVGRSAEAVHAYQRALDLKPNYMRAWTNMGIALANTGNYDRWG